MKKLRYSLLFFLPILILVFLVFKKIFLPGILWGGDAPYFYPDAIKQLLSKPSFFTERGIPFGGTNQVLWLWPLMFIFGLIGKFGGSDIALRSVFLIPSITLSILGPYFLARFLKLGKVTQFISVLLYVLNTYFILLIDGGQVGVALSYGIFPFTVLFLLKGNFLSSLIASEALILADPRIFVISFLTVILWNLLEKRFSFKIFYIVPVLIILNLYWLLPVARTNDLNIPLGVNNLNLISLINPIMLFSPHWPGNIYGKISYPAFYFILFPILIFGNLLFKRKDVKTVNLLVLFLFFSFLSKGGNYPLGFFYNFLIDKVPFGVAFRDPSKFFIPVMMFGGFLVGETVSRLNKKWLLVASYLLVVLTTLPGITTKLNFLLSNHTVDSSFESIYRNIVADPSQFRTLWFPEKHPLSYETNEISAIDARDLTTFRPFASMNASEDVFNFLNNPNYVEWLSVLGIKYIFLSGSARNPSPSEDEAKLFDEIKSLVARTPNIEKQLWGTDFDIYKIANIFPRTWTADKLIAVVGSDLPQTQPAIYFEDGKWDPKAIENKDPSSIKIALNGGSDTDLAMSFLQKYFLSSKMSKSSSWANYSSQDYLKYKYELLIRNFVFNDFDYGKGVAFSTSTDEKIVFDVNVPKNSQYILASRTANIDNQKLSWSIEEKTLPKGRFEYEVKNNSSLGVFNVFALIPLDEFNYAQKTANDLISYYGTIDIDEISGAKDSPGGFWKVTTTRYNSKHSTLPVYSMVVGEYLK